MRHFIAYHNTERMGQTLHEDDPLCLLTSKPVQPLLGNAVWVIVGDGKTPKRYSLGSVFVVDEVGDTAEQGFKYYVRGQGHIFLPSPSLNNLHWFTEVFKSMAHFSLGVQEVKEPRLIVQLVGLASEVGYRQVFPDVSEVAHERDEA